VLDDDEIILAQRPFDLSFERAVPIEVMVRGDVISANVAGIDIEAQDPGPRPPALEYSSMAVLVF